MQTWRRTFATSIMRLTHNTFPTTAPSPTFLRCAQLLQESKHGEKSQHEDKRIELRGFIRSVRKQKRFAFAEISDGSSLEPVQAVLKPEQAADLSTGAAVQISGYWTPCPPDKSQSHELQDTSVNYVGAAEPETYPIQKKYHGPNFLRSLPHLRLRTPFNSLLSRFRSECIYQLGNVFRSHPDGAFTQVQPPLITSSDCEGAGETFTVLPREAVDSKDEERHFFQAPKYLTVSSQLHLEAYAAELGSVWTLSPTFRAEKSDTPRHLSEFYMLEAEMNFMYSMDQLTESVEHIIRDLTRRLYDSPVGQEVLSTESEGSLRERWNGLMNEQKWQRITYTEAVQVLQQAVQERGASFENPPAWNEGLQLEHEKYIVDVLCQGRPVFVTDYPKTVKPFYMLPSSISDPSAPGETVACFDLLLPEVSEVAGGSLREHRLENLIESMRTNGLIKPRSLPEDGHSQGAPKKSAKQREKEKEPLYPYLTAEEDLGQLQWYADLRRWGTAPHAGFGMGFDRFLGYLTGVSSVRDVVAFPRYFKRADC